MRTPLEANYEPDNALRVVIATYIRGRSGVQSIKGVQRNLPQAMKSWGGVRIKGGGDSIRCVYPGRRRLNERDASYVCVSGAVINMTAYSPFDKYEHIRGNENQRTVQYGRIERILECNLPNSVVLWGALTGARLLLAVITPCLTRGQDAADTVVSYRLQHKGLVVVDLNAVESLVGRVATRGAWGIIDQSSKAARTVFVDDANNGEE